MNRPADQSPQPTVEPPPGYRDITWDQAAGKHETSVPLDHLPAGVTFADDFPEPIRHDAVHKRLIYRGYMYHGSYAFLRNVSRDSHFLVALDTLYAATATPHREGHPVAWRAAGAAAVAAAGAVAWRFLS